jgi:hypothetical protein
VYNSSATSVYLDSVCVLLHHSARCCLVWCLTKARVHLLSCVMFMLCVCVGVYRNLRYYGMCVLSVAAKCIDVAQCLCMLRQLGPGCMVVSATVITVGFYAAAVTVRLSQHQLRFPLIRDSSWWWSAAEWPGSCDVLTCGLVGWLMWQVQHGYAGCALQGQCAQDLRVHVCCST